MVVPVDEVVVRDGPTGPRAALPSGADVWEVIRAWHGLLRNEADASDDELRAGFLETHLLSGQQLEAALHYYRSHPSEVDARIRDPDSV